MNNSQHLMICRTLGIVDVLFSAIFLFIPISWLDTIVFENVHHGLVIKYSGDLVGDIKFVSNFEDAEAKHCGIFLMEQSADYVRDHFAKNLYIITAIMLGYLTLGVGICVCSVIQNKWALRTLFIAEFGFSVILLITCIAFYSKSYCVLEYAMTLEGKYRLRIPAVLILLLPIFAFIYKGSQILLLFFLDQMVSADMFAVGDPRRDSEEQRQQLINVALEQAAAPNTTAVYITSSKQDNIVVVKSIENSNDPMECSKDQAANVKPKKGKYDKKQFRKELAKTGGDDYDEETQKDDDNNDNPIESPPSLD